MEGNILERLTVFLTEIFQLDSNADGTFLAVISVAAIGLILLSLLKLFTKIIRFILIGVIVVTAILWIVK